MTEKSDNDKDLLMNLSDNTQQLIEKGVIPPEVMNIRDVVNDVNIKTLDEYSESLLYRAYYVAKKRRTNSVNIIAKELKISVKLLEYYLRQYPKLGLVIQMGLMDATESMKTDIVDSLYKAAMGQTVKESSVITETDYDDEGVVLSSKQKISEVGKYIPPNTQAALELLRKLDPSWNPKLNINVSEDKTLHVIEDINVAVDYRKLSADALRELIESQRGTYNGELNKLEDNSSVNSLREQKFEERRLLEPTPNENEVELTEEEKKHKERCANRKKVHRTHKVKNIIESHNNLIDKMRNNAKKEAEKALKENK